jgi:glycosyltransferase involved in cell wall biosynthesis
MRVLMLGKGWFPFQLGGLNRYFRELIEQLPEARGVVVGPADNAPMHVTAVSNHSSPLLRRLVAFARAAHRSGSGVDLVDAHFAVYAYAPLLLGSLRHKPLIVHFHGPWTDENLSAGDRSRWRQLARRRIEHTVYARADLVVTLTGAFRRLVIERYGVSPWRTAVVSPGVDLQCFTPSDRARARSRFGVASDEFIVCCVRRLVPRMGLDVLVDAWGQTAATTPQARLLIAGDGDLKSMLASRIAQEGLQGSVTLLGRIADDDLRALYSAADVNVVPSIAYEGFGLVVVEAAACGTPSIVSRVGGLPEAIVGLGPNLEVPAGDPGALAARVMRAKQGHLPTREHTRRWAEDRSWESVAAEHRQLFERTVRGETGPRKPRVVFLDHVAQLSGGELAMQRLINAVGGIDAHVILAEDGPLVARLLRTGISVEVLPMRQRTREMRKDRVRSGRSLVPAAIDTLGYTLRLARRLRRLRPDIVHTNSLKSGVYGSLAARLVGARTVWHLRDRLERDYMPVLAILLVRTATRHLADVVVSNSAVTRRTLGRDTRAVVIPSVVELGSPPLESHRRPAECALAVGMVGRLAPWKGQDVFLRAFAEAFPTGSQRAIIVGASLFGETEAQYADSLHRLAVDLGIAERVEFRGHRDDVAQELRAMDILVHASTIPEPFGQVLIEGMSARLPVVATQGGGPEEIITPGVDGLLYPRGNAAALAEILVELDTKPQLRAQLGTAGARRAEAFSPAVVATQLMAAYELVLGSAL